MTLYVHYNEQIGENICGFYSDQIHDSIPTPNIALTDEQWLSCINNQGSYRIDPETQTLENYTPPPPSLEEIKTQAGYQIHQQSIAAREQCANQVDHYQLTSWAEKLQRAQRIVAGEGTAIDEQLVQAECDQRGLCESILTLAQKQCDKGHALAHQLIRLEGIEHKTLATIKAATQTEAIDSVMVNFNQQLTAIIGDTDD